MCGICVADRQNGEREANESKVAKNNMNMKIQFSVNIINTCQFSIQMKHYHLFFDINYTKAFVHSISRFFIICWHRSTLIVMLPLYKDIWYLQTFYVCFSSWFDINAFLMRWTRFQWNSKGKYWNTRREKKKNNNIFRWI